jgi:hypothetical protein
VKRLIVILLLFLIAEKTTGLLCSNFNDVKVVLGIEDKNKDESKKEKKEILEFIHDAYHLSAGITAISFFPLFSTPVTPSPALDDQTPPPDMLP